MQDLNDDCSFRRQKRHAASGASAAPHWVWPGTCLLVSLILLCGCMPLPFDMEPSPSDPPKSLQPSYSENQAVPASLRKRGAEKRPLHKSHKVKQLENLAAIEPSALIGKEPSAVRKLLGSPADISEKDVSLVWTYGTPECAFQVYFYPDIKTSMFHALQYTAIKNDGGKLDLSKGCVQRLLAMRK